MVDESPQISVTRQPLQPTLRLKDEEELMFRWLAGVLLVIPLLGLGEGLAQKRPQWGPGAGPERGRQFGGTRVMGTIASVGVERFTVKTPDGSEQTVLVDEQTRYQEGQKDIQLEDLKPGDRVFVRVQADTGTDLKAQMVRRVTGEPMQRFGGEPRAFGEIIAIEKNQLKLRDPRQGERIVKFDEQTAFVKEGKPSTLQELKVGDRIMAVGKETSDGFTATRIMSGPMQRRRLGGPDSTREMNEPRM
jgi:hypothetical protein